MTLPVFLADPATLAAAAPGGRARLDGPDGRHAVSVRRVRAGERIDLVDGAGRRVRGAVSTLDGRDALELDVEEVTDEPPPAVRLVLVQALGKGGRDEQAVETAVEVGADAVVPWRAARCVSVWEGAKIAKGRERWAAVAQSAAKQARRARVPEVAEMATTKQLAARVSEAVAAGSAVLLAHEEATAALASARLPRPGGGGGGDGSHADGGAGAEVRTDDGERAGEGAGVGTAEETAGGAPCVAVIVGPEGGIGEDEVAALVAAGAQPVRLGPHVLRTSTAGPVALAVLAQRLGFWG